jgi:hypothetical protein
VPFLSVLTPYRGTALFDKLEEENRVLKDRGWQFYNGYNVAFEPRNMRAGELQLAHHKLWQTAFSPVHVIKRIMRAIRLNPGAFLLSLAMNGFYGWKALTGNAPLDMQGRAMAVQTGPHLFQPRLMRQNRWMNLMGTARRVSERLRSEI